MKKEKSFTLIELLVVIAIIGLLSSVVLVSMKGTRDKAKIAKALGFSQSIQHVLGAYAVGWWSFEGNYNDSSGYDNNCVSQGVSLVPGIEQLGYTAEFPNLAYLDCGSGRSLSQNTMEWTMEAWVNLSAAPRDDVILHKGLDTGIAFGYSLEYKSSTGLWKACFGGSGSLMGCVDYSHTPQRDTWYHIAATFNSGTAVIYFDGEVKGSATFTFNTHYGKEASAVPFFIGKHATYGSFMGYIDEVRIYEQAISVVEIEKHYAEGLKNHKNLTLNNTMEATLE